ncbi:transketolase [Mucilaginibacter sp. L3T2-6]|uniref:transketolase n=1 Tax=Mucilaginibacter sp. L3T2-6 TaxID=3062491 RepID=UPI002674990B|nr:transketolase [Mucilaginibacter sp. L3T2-6]MDO3643582.1 transketolase [Mucilaginibacter sp. L3T2-6]MDV6216033.1 transketolase [Mucilaginibacter sp. L3T2-6]
MSANNQDIETLGINTARILAADAVQKANSGHPGTPMALAPMAHVLWTKAMTYNAKNPEWANRDRFILSAGHACMLQYAYLYLTGYDLTLDDIKNFRQMNSKTAGHPEYGLCPGVEVTTGPLGQGFANAIGFAIGQKHLAARYNKPGFNLFDYKIYVICSDGDMMEGVTSEAASIAGHLELGNLIFLYDNNHISIEGSTDIAFNEDVSARFRAYGWHVQDLPDVNDIHALELALVNAKAETQKPSLINVRSLIAYGSPNKSGTAGSHGSPLGPDEVKLVKEFFGFDPDKSFVVPDEVLDFYHKSGEKGAAKEEKWNKLFADYKAKYPELAAEYELLSNGGLPEGWKDALPVFKASDPKVATRVASGKALNAIAAKLPSLIGGAADLAPSTETNLKEFDSFTSENRAGRNFHFGIREHAMGSALNGMALTKGVIPFGATFLMFSEYQRPPIRLAAIMKIKPIFVYTHDSIGLGEDGTTHQPIEQLASLRSIPNLLVIRPADANESVHAWRVAIEHKGGPVALIFTRQGLPIIDQDKYAKAENVEKGAYILSEGSKGPDLILMATGSEVSLIMQAQEKLEAEGISTRVVSMPSWELFEKQDAAYKEKVLPKANKKRLAVEMASPMGWHKYTTDEGDMLGMTTFGESAPAEDLYKHFGFTVDNVVAKAKALLK